MSARVVLFAFVASLSLASALATPCASAGGTDGATVVRGTGRMRLQSNQPWHDAGPGKVFGAGTTVEASGTDPMDLTLPDGVQITLEPGARGQFQSPGKLPTEHNGWARGYHLEVTAGELEVRVPSDPPAERAFLVSTTAGTLTDWRGSVHLTVDGDMTAAAIYAGALVIGSNGDGFPVFQPSGIVIRKGSKPKREAGIPPPPEWLARPPAGVTPPLAFVHAGERATLGFAWNPSPNAIAYRVELASDEAFTQVFNRGATTSNAYTLLEPVPALPTYYARVLAVGDDTIVGGWSRPHAIRVVRVAFPDNTPLGRDGAYMLRQGTAVTVANGAGLEAAFESYSGPPPDPPLPLIWMKAPSTFELADDGTRVVHLRDPSLPDNQFRFVLAKRQLHATVDICPRRARWPGDSINVRVLLVDPSGRLDPSKEQVRIDTTVSGGPIPVEWRQSGPAWYARIPPQTTISLAPWMLSVTAHDANGVDLGDGFVEVDGPTPPDKPAARAQPQW